MKIRAVSIYLVSNIIAALLPIAAIPVLTRYFSPEDYGRWILFSTILMYVSTLTRWEINNALKVKIINERGEFSKYASTAVIFGCGLFFVFLIFWFGGLAASLEWNGFSSFHFLALGGLAFFRYQTINLHQLLQIENRAIEYGVWAILSNGCLYGLTIFLIIQHGLGWHARMLSEVIVAFVSFLVALKFWRGSYGLILYFDKRKMLEMLRFSTPFMANSTAAYLLATVDKLLINKFLGEEQLGLYSVSAQLASSLSLFVWAISPVWESVVYGTEKTKQNFIKLIISYILLAVVLIALLIVMPNIISVIIPVLLGKNFQLSEQFVLPAITATAFAGLFMFMQPFVVILNKLNSFVFVNAGMVIVFLVTSWHTIPFFGAQAAGYSLAIVYALGCFVVFFWIVKFYKALRVS